MPNGIRRHLTYANVVATLALMLSLTAGAYAAVRVTGKEVVDRSLSGKDIRPESIRSKHVRGLTLGDLKTGAGQYYIRSETSQGTGLAEAQARCANNDIAISGGTRGAPGNFLEGDGPGDFNQATRALQGWTGVVQGTTANPQVTANVTVLCLTVPAP
jgi:hypothetical protein